MFANSAIVVFGALGFRDSLIFVDQMYKGIYVNLKAFVSLTQSQMNISFHHGV